MTYYCIRHIPSGKIIPCANGRMDRGGSHVEPSDPDEHLPKVFSAPRYAKGWLTTWLKGAVVHSSGYDSFSGEYYEETELVPKPHRKREEYEIITLSFLFGK